MRRAWIIPISLLVVLVLLIGMGAGACGGGNGEETALPTGEEEEAPPAVLPTPGLWTASTDIGELSLTVSNDSTAIVRLVLDIPQGFECGDMTLQSIESLERWPITDGQFTIEEAAVQYTVTMAAAIEGLEWSMVIQGSFDETGTHASVTLEVNVGGETCPAGTWEASPWDYE